MEVFLTYSEFAIFSLISSVLLIISWRDIRSRIISNKILIVLFFLAITYMSVQLVMPNILAALAIVVIFFPLFVCNVMGGGDIKLMSVLSLTLPWKQLIDFFLLTAFAGGAIGVIGLVFFNRVTRARGIPYGVAISLSYLLNNTFFNSM